MGTIAKTNFLISEIESKIRQQYSKWYVGTAERDNAWRVHDTEMIVFNALDKDVIDSVYRHLVRAGMKGKQPIGKKPNYLYLYRNDGRLPPSFVYR